MTLRQALAFAAVLVLLQTVCTALFSGAHGIGEGYLKLLNWDSAHYASISAHGYSYPLSGQVVSDDIHAGRANVVFFPGYPLAAALVHTVTGLSTEVSLLVVAQACAWIAWSYFLLILARAGLSGRRCFWSAVAVAVYPSSFFMVTGYTESLFMAGMLGFFFWSDRWVESESVLAWVLALLHGWVLSLTRIVGFAVDAYPAFRGFFRKQLRPMAIVLFFLSIAASVLFFVYCHYRFGDWAVYFKLEEIGWGNRRLYFAILNPLSYVPRFFFEPTVDSFSRSSVTFSAVLFVAWGLSEWRLWKAARAFSERRTARALVAFVMFYIALTGKANSNMDSMLRYTLPVYVLLVMNFAELKWAPKGKWGFGLFLATCLGIEFWNMYRFTHGHWVA
jgi:hypothetical protein